VELKNQTSRGFSEPSQDMSSMWLELVRLQHLNAKIAEDWARILTTETVKAKIPAGVDTGSNVKVKGYGNAGRGGALYGDLILEVTVVLILYSQERVMIYILIFL